MAFTVIKCLLILLIIFVFQEHILSYATNAPITTPTKLPTNSTHTPTKSSNTTATEGSSSGGGHGFSFPNNKGLLKRMLYVAVGCSALIALYFIVKTIRTKSRKSKSKKYGMIFSSGDVEMQPLDNDDDDDDMTVFDRKTRK